MKRDVKTKTKSYDVVVVGGGLSGMIAAIASARQGIKTALVHARHVLGGNASSEIRMHVCGASENMAKPELEESGILYEIMLDNKMCNDYFSYSKWDMVLFDKVKSEKNLTVYLNTTMEDCILKFTNPKSIIMEVEKEYEHNEQIMLLKAVMIMVNSFLTLDSKQC